MLDRFFVRAATVDRVRSCWVGALIERYVEDLDARGYAGASIRNRTQVLVAFASFAWERGAREVGELEAHLEAFARQWVSDVSEGRSAQLVRRHRQRLRSFVENMICFAQSGRPRTRARWQVALPFAGLAPGFFEFLREERGLREATVCQYAHWLRRFEAYLRRVDCHDLAALSPGLVSGFVTDASLVGLSAASRRYAMGVLRVFLRYAHAEGLVARDLAFAAELPQQYKLAALPRSISWDAVRLMLDAVDRDTIAGRRDYAILLLLVTYGLRAREVAALTLDDIDWARERLMVRERKADHATAYPLAAPVGAAIVAYLKGGRPQSRDRALFFRLFAPTAAITTNAVSLLARRRLRRAAVVVARAGSHSLRHACAQRLLDSGFPLKSIGDYVGHSSPAATQVYTKVQIEQLREVALGDIEALS